mgnify:FL=1
MNPEEIPEWIPFLKRIPLFKDLTGEDLRAVAERLKSLSLPRGAILFHQGDRGDSFYLITSGQVHLVIERQGQKTVAAHLGPGDAAGELALLTGESCPHTALLETTSEFLVLSKKDFARIVREKPSLLLHLSRTLSARFAADPRSREQGSRTLPPQILVLLSALDPLDRTVLAVRLAHALSEQTRRRVLLVEMHEEGGAAAANALGLKPQAVTESMLREEDLRHPALLGRLVQVHPSGLGFVTLAPSVLGGRLYRSIFLLMNLLRDNNDIVLVSLDAAFGDVERSVLYEADQWILAGCPARKGVFTDIETRLRAFSPEPKRLTSVWLGDEIPSELTLAPSGEWTRIPWTAEIAERFKAGDNPLRAMERSPRSVRAIDRLARRFGRLRVGLAMGTGAALGFSLVGILKCLKRENLPVDIVAGTSIGSLIGGLTALGMEPEEIEDLVTHVDKAWVYENLFWDLTVPRSGVFAGTTLYRFIRSYFGTKEFHDLELPYACVATDIETGEEVVFKDGRVAEAIRASCGIPLIFAPFHYQGRFLVDGGLVDPVPIQLVSQMGADLLVSVNLTLPAGDRKSALKARRDARHPLGPMGIPGLQQLKDLTLPDALKAPHLGQIFFQMIYTMEYEIARSRSALAHVAIHPDLSRFSWTEFHRGKELVDAGERVAEAVVPKIKALLPYFSDKAKTTLVR